MPNFSDELFMRKCIALARKGERTVAPNPMVGAILVRDGKIIGKGWHRKYGSEHAEIEAIRDAKNDATGATLFVNLEPCNHHGKTPPCTEAIIRAGIERVVIGLIDPNPDVTGNGISRLKHAGIDCTAGVLALETEHLNERFIANVTKNRPFVFIKIAHTLDGFIAPQKGTSNWITGVEARKQVHELRASSDAVLVGAETIRKDDPELTVRLVQGMQPLRCILSASLDLPIKSKVFTDKFADQTIIFTTKKSLNRFVDRSERLRVAKIKICEVREDLNQRASLVSLLASLYKMGVFSLMVEGGATIFSAFLNHKFVDRIDSFLAPMIIGKGLHMFNGMKPRSIANAMTFTTADMSQCGNDLYANFYPSKQE